MATPQKAPPPYDRIWQRISCRTACTMAALLSALQLRRWGQGPDARRVAAGGSTRRAAERATLIYGQPYGRLPYGRFFDNIFFLFLEFFLSFSEKNKFRHFFMSQKNFQVKIWWVEKISRNKLVR